MMWPVSSTTRVSATLSWRAIYHPRGGSRAFRGGRPMRSALPLARSARRIVDFDTIGSRADQRSDGPRPARPLGSQASPGPLPRRPQRRISELDETSISSSSGRVTSGMSPQMVHLSAASAVPASTAN